MASEGYEVASIPFVGGIDTKSDAKTVQVGKLTVLENGVFTEGGSVRKRHGYDAVPAETVSGEDLAGSPSGVGSRGKERVLLTDEKLYGYSERGGAWLERGTYCPYGFTAEEVVADNSEQGVAECATAAGVTCYIWQEGSGIYAAAYDDATGAAYVDKTELASADASRPRAVAIGGTILLLWVDTASDNIKGLSVRSWSVESDLAGTAVNVATDLATDEQYDCCETDGDYAILAYSSDGSVSTGVRIGHVGSDGSIIKLVATGTAANGDGLTVAYDGADLVWLAYISAGGTEIFKYVLSDMVKKAGATNATTNGDDLTFLIDDDLTLTLLYTSVGATPDLSSVKIQAIDEDTLAFDGSATSVLHCALASQGFNLGGQAYVLVCHDSRTGLQDAYYLLNVSGEVCGQIFWGEGGYVHASSNHTPRLRAREGHGPQIPLLFKRRVDVDGDDIPVFEHKGLRRVTFDAEPHVSTAEAEGVLYAGGSMLWAYDGTNVTEAAPLMFPDMDLDGGDAIITAAGTNDFLANGEAVNYRVYYEWRNALGQRVRSAAASFQVENDSGSPGCPVLSIPSLSFTGVEDVAIVVYRTEVDTAGLYYRVSSPDPTATGDNGWVSNSSVSNSVQFQDDMTDADLVDNEIDYISAGELANETPKPGRYLASIGTRLFMAGNGIGKNSVQYSKLRVPGAPHTFSGELVADDGPEGGGVIQGITHLNGVPVIFKERSIYALEGAGPDNLGLSGDYVSREITTDVGLEAPGAHAIIPTGIIFKSEKGFYLLDQGLNVSYIGAEAEAYNSLTFTSAEVIPNTNLVVFLASDGSSVVYDYFYGQWGIWTNHLGVSACNVVDEYAYLREDGRVYVQSEKFTDAGVPFSLRVRTAPIRPPGVLQGFWKLLRFQVLGDYRSAHRLRVSLYYDRDEAPFEVYSWDPSDVVSTDQWGSGATWGSGDVWGGAAGGAEYQHEHRPMRSKAQTIRFEFEDIPGTNPGASYEITEIAIQYLLWDGLSRLSTARKY